MTYHPRDKAQALTVGTQAERKAYVQEWIAKRQKLAAGGLITTAALVLPLVAEAQASQDFVDADGIAGVRSASVTDDGRAQLVLDDGRTVMVGAADVRTGPDGSVQISSAAAELVEDMIGAEVAADAAMPGGAAFGAAVLGLGAVAAAASSSSDDAAPPPPPPAAPDPVDLNLAAVQTQSRVSELFGVRPSSDATSLTVTVGEGEDAVELAGVLDGNQIWRIPGQDPAIFAAVQGEQPISFVALNDEGEEVDSGANTANIDTLPPEIEIDTPIAGDNVLNAEELGQSLTISGTTDADDGDIVAVTVNGAEFSAEVQDGAWSVEISAEELAELDLQSGETIEVTADVEDAAGNTARATASFDTDFVAEITINEPIADGELTAFDTFEDLQISGTSNGIQEGREVTVTFADQTYTGMIGADGTWSVTVPQEDLDALDAETDLFVISATASDEAGNIADVSVDLPADLSFIPLSVDAPAEGTLIDSGVAAAGVTVSGSGTPGAEVTVEMVDVVKTTEIAADGTWSVPFATDELPDDGDIDINVSALLDGVDVGTASIAVTKDTVTPAIAINAPADGTPLGLDEAEEALAVSGTASNIDDGTEVTVELTDPEGTVLDTATTTVTGGAWDTSFAADTVAGLPDESTVTVTASAAGVSASVDVETDFQPVLLLDVPEDGIVDTAEIDAADSIGGTARGIEEGELVTVEIEDADGNTIFSAEVPVEADGSFEAPLTPAAIDALAPGQTFTLKASGSNAAGREAEPFASEVLIYGEALNFLTSFDQEGDSLRMELYIDPRTEIAGDGGIQLAETMSFDPSQITFAGGLGFPPGLLPIVGTDNAADGEVTLAMIGFIQPPGNFALDERLDTNQEPLMEFNMDIQDASEVIRIDMATQGAGAYAQFIGTDGDDTIEALAGIDSLIRGRGGDDTIDLSEVGVHTVVFEVDSVANGSDMVTGFDLGGATPDRIGMAGLDNEILRGDGTEFQVTDGGAVGDDVGFLVFTTALPDLSLDSFAGIVDELTGVNNGDVMVVLASDGTDAAIKAIALDDDGEVVLNESGEVHATFEGLGDLSGFSAANIIGFEAHTT